MNKTHMMYFEKDDILHVAISDGPEAGSVEISPNLTAELNAKGELIGIEILHASLFVRDTVMDSVQSKLLGLVDAAAAAAKAGATPKRVKSGILEQRNIAGKVAETAVAYPENDHQ